MGPMNSSTADFVKDVMGPPRGEGVDSGGERGEGCGRGIRGLRGFRCIVWMERMRCWGCRVSRDMKSCVILSSGLCGRRLWREGIGEALEGGVEVEGGCVGGGSVDEEEEGGGYLKSFLLPLMDSLLQLPINCTMEAPTPASSTEQPWNAVNASLLSPTTL